MKRLALSLFASGLLLLARGTAGAAAGSVALNFLRQEVGPRQIGMGGLGAGLPLDVYSSAYNPAWTATLNTQQVGVSHVSWLQDSAYNDAFYALPTRFGAFTARAQTVSYGRIAGYDAANTPTADYTASDLLGGVGFAATVGRRVYLGGMIKAAQERIADAKGAATMADLGAGWYPSTDPRFETLSIGLAIKNFGKSVKFDREAESLPTTIDAGAGMRFLDDKLIVGFDVHFPKGQTQDFSAGAEYELFRELSVRAGYRTDPSQGPGITTGIGLRVQQAEINYAFLPMGELGATHHIGLVLRFGGAARKALQEGISLMRANRPAEAILKFEDALRRDPADPEAALWIRRAHRQIQGALEEVR